MVDGRTCCSPLGGALRLSGVGSETFIVGESERSRIARFEIGHLRDHASCTGRCPDLLCAVDPIARKDEQEERASFSEVYYRGTTVRIRTRAATGRPSRGALLLQRSEKSLACCWEPWRKYPPEGRLTMSSSIVLFSSSIGGASLWALFALDVSLADT